MTTKQFDDIMEEFVNIKHRLDVIENKIPLTTGTFIPAVDPPPMPMCIHRFEMRPHGNMCVLCGHVGGPIIR